MRDDTRFMKKQTLLMQDMLIMLLYLEEQAQISKDILETLREMQKQKNLHRKDVDKDLWFDSTDTKNYLNISESTLYRLRSDHILIWKKNRGKYYYLKSSLINEATLADELKVKKS